MKTMRALLVGCAVGVGVGFLFAPRHEDVLRAEQRERQEMQEEQQRKAMREVGKAPMMPEQPTDGYVGNVQTHIYHAAAAPNLPGEENREYFATREEAEAAGYRPSAQLASAH